MEVNLNKCKLRKIGDIARDAGVNIQTIRYYERRGILKPDQTLPSGYRLYEPSAADTIRFVKNAQELGFTLTEIEDLLKLRIPSSGRCAKVRERATARLADVKAKQKMLRRIERVLTQLIADCKTGKQSTSCPIIEGME